MRKSVIAARAIVLALFVAVPAYAEVPPGAAFSDLEGVCARDEETLWGVSLCGPTLIVDRATRAVSANRADPEGKFALAGTNVWGGTLPDGVPVANTAVDWAGLKWTMVLSPLPERGTARRVLLAHESFHRIQGQLGIPLSSAANAHLDTEAGRTWMRLEMRALAAAMAAKEDDPRNAAARDALAFRAARLAAFPGADAEERALDRSEGLAEYTGVRLATADSEAYAAALLQGADANQALARSYAYATGPAWGLLLDRHEGYWREARWRRFLGQKSPAEALAGRLRLDRTPMETRIARYNGAAIAAEEAARAASKEARMAAWRAAFTQGPRLVAPLAQSSMEFNPNAVTPAEGLGQVYATLTVRDAWGEFIARGDALIASDMRSLVAAQPTVDDTRVVGPDWVVSLKPGWRAVQKDGGVVVIEPAS
jgi:hypothetical protein